MILLKALNHIYHMSRARFTYVRMSQNACKMTVKGGDIAVVIAPHPDDEILGCGGIISHMRAIGCDVHIIFMTRGENVESMKETEKVTTIDLRTRLAKKASETIGVNQNRLYFLNYNDGGIHFEDKETSILTSMLDNISPNLIFIPAKEDLFPDHIKTNNIIQNICRKRNLEIYEYLTWFWLFNKPKETSRLIQHKIFSLPLNNVEMKLKKDALRIYLKTKDNKGNYISGNLPDVLYKMLTQGKEFFFKAQESVHPIKIAYFLDSIVKVGGVERIFIDKANYLAEHFGYETYIITMSQSNESPVYPLSKKVKHIDIGVNYYIIYKMWTGKKLFSRIQKNRILRKRIESVIKEERFDIIDTPFPDIANVLSKINFEGKRVFESHIVRNHLGKNDGTDRSWMKKIAYLTLWNWHMHRICRKFDTVVVLSNMDKTLWNEAKMVKIIPNTTFVTPNATTTRKEKKCVTMGRLVYQKNHAMLIRAWKTVNEWHPDWKLEIYGEGQEEGKLKLLIKELNLEEKVEIKRPNANVCQILAGANIFILSSRYEGFGLVLIEAMSLGIPGISTDCPAGPSEIINDGENGVLVDNEDEKQMAEKIIDLIQNEHRRNSIGEKGKESVQRYSPEIVMGQWKSLFDSLMNKDT